MTHAFARFGIGSLVMCLCLAGCSTFTNYSKKMDPVGKGVRANNLNGAQSAFPEKDADSKTDRVVYLLEKGTLLHAMSKPDESNQVFAEAHNIFEAEDMRAKVALGKGAEAVGAELINDKALTYQGEAYERLCMHTLQALNYAMLGKKDDARVEMKLAYEQATAVAEKNRREIEQLRKSAGINRIDPNMDTSATTRQFFEPDQLTAVQASPLDPYQNAFAACLSSVMYEVYHDYGNAYIDCQLAHDIMPGAQTPGRELARLASLGGSTDRKTEWEQKYGPARTVPETDGELFITFQCGLAAHKEQVKFDIPIPIYDRKTNSIVIVQVPVAFPKYRPTPFRASSMEVICDGTSLGSTELLADLDLIALKDFHNRAGAMILRQSIRSLLKGAAGYGSRGQLGQIGDIDISSFLTGRLLSFTEQADLRSWLLLPSNVQALRTSVPAGEHKVDFVLKDRSGNLIDKKSGTVVVEKGKFTFLNLRGIDTFVGEPQMSLPL